MKKEVLKTVIINLDLKSTGQGYSSASFTISNVTFISDEVLVRSILYRNSASTANFVITSDLVDWNPLGYFSSASVTLTPIYIKYRLEKPVNGTYPFGGKRNTEKNSTEIILTPKFITPNTEGINAEHRKL